MIFATLRDGGRDGVLLVVSRDRRRAARVPTVPTLQDALDRWDEVLPVLQDAASRLEAGDANSFPVDEHSLAAPLPRAHAFLDGSAYPHHMGPIRQARGAAMPADFFERPLMYQGCSDTIIGPREPIRLTEDESFGVDIEAEVVVITGEVPQGTGIAEAPRHVRLLGILNDVSLRGLIPQEIGRGFGFLQGKSASSMGPFVVTPDEVGELWNGSRLSGRYRCDIRGEWLGDLDPGVDAAFGYDALIAHAARTRDLRAGTIIGAGALANEDRRNGNGCIAEARAREQIEFGEAKTPYLRFGDEIRLEMFDRSGKSVFGAIQQRLERVGTEAE